MNWLFWKKQVSVSNNSKIDIPLSLLNEKPDDSFSPWKKESSYLDTQYHVILWDTTPKPSTHSIFLKDINMSSSIETETLQRIKAKMRKAIMKDEVLQNLHKILDNLHKECEEDGFEEFSEIARKNAKQILNFIYNQFSNYEYDIYPTDNREIFITCNPEKRKRVSILCDSDGSVAYFLTWNGKNSRFRSDEINKSFYDLLTEVFKKFDSLTKMPLSISSKDSDFYLKNNQVSSF